MGVQINIAGTENETAAELKRIRTQFVLTMACGGSARSSLGVVASNKMQKVRRLEARGAIREPLRIDQERKCDSGLLAEESGIVHIAQTDGREAGALSSELLPVVAQLRNMLAAEDSTVMAKEDDNGGAAFP